MADSEKQMMSVEEVLKNKSDNVNLKTPSTSRGSDKNLSTIYNKKQLELKEQTYKLESFEKNYLLLFIQQDVNDLEKCEVITEKNVFLIEKTFQMFGFEIEKYINLTKDEIFEKLKIFKTKDFSDYGCIIVVVLTNETFDGSLRAMDALFKERDIMIYLKNKENLSMVTKPKILVVQTHRETKSTTITHQGEKVLKDEYRDDFYTLPLSSDILVLRSSYPGRSSHNEEKYGSWFIWTLCQEIVRNSPKLDFECIITIVRRNVSRDMEYTFNAVTGESNEFNLMPVSTSTFIRKLYFRKYRDYTLWQDFYENIFD